MERGECYVTLASDSSKTFFTDNTIAHFTTQLPHPLCPNGRNFEVGLAEIFFPPEIDYFRTPIFVYSDVSAPVIMGDICTKLLRVCSPTTQGGHFIFPHIYYSPVEKRNFNTITISSRTRTGERYPFSDSDFPAIAVLHFRPI